MVTKRGRSAALAIIALALQCVPAVGWSTDDGGLKGETDSFLYVVSSTTSVGSKSRTSSIP
jgi:hypothetical protein